tara:strand:+ start:17 stop:610 length:594 start_codon:yes stop_codon:yes gene_type:complete
MNAKSIIQLFIFFIIVVFLFFFIKNTFWSKTKDIIDLDLEKKNLSHEIDDKENFSNIIEHLNYRSIDANGNEYILNAEFGEVSQDDQNLIMLKNVSGKLILKNNSDIYIYADYAKYNSKNFDTNFYQNVSGFFELSKIYSDNLDLLFKDNLGIMYNNIKFFDKNLEVAADKILLNLSNGDLNIEMFNKEKKIKIIKN